MYSPLCVHFMSSKMHKNKGNYNKSKVGVFEHKSGHCYIGFIGGPCYQLQQNSKAKIKETNFCNANHFWIRG